MTQQLPRVLAGSSDLMGVSSEQSYQDSIDSSILPAIMASAASGQLENFRAALLSAIPEEMQVELKVGPIKRSERIGVKVGEYTSEKGEGHSPYSQFVTDILRASYICETAEDMVRTYEGLMASQDFEVVRLKNKIGQCKGPFNLHVNAVFHPVECRDSILIEVQFYPRAVFDLQHRQHLAYELKRAPAVKDLL